MDTLNYSIRPDRPEYVNSGRSSIPEDATKNLFLALYEQVVFSNPATRRAAIKMLSAIYGIE
jgi:hypothetical protein